MTEHAAVIAVEGRVYVCGSHGLRLEHACVRMCDCGFRLNLNLKTSLEFPSSLDTPKHLFSKVSVFSTVELKVIYIQRITHQLGMNFKVVEPCYQICPLLPS